MDNTRTDKKEVSDLLSNQVGLIRLDHVEGKSVTNAFGLFDHEANAVHEYVARLRVEKTHLSEVIEYIWNSDKLQFYQRVYGLFYYGWLKGKEHAVKQTETRG